MNSNGNIGLDATGVRASSGPEMKKRMPSIASTRGEMKVVSRPKGFTSDYERRRHNRKVSMILVCAAAVIIVSAFAVASVGKGVQSTVPGHVSIPPFPLLVFGYTTDSGANPIACHVNITDLRTGAYNNTVLSDGTGFYSLDISTGLSVAYVVGDTIRVVANTTTLTGTNSGVLTSTPYIQIDVTVSASIPEFTGIVIPIVGMVSVLAVATVVSNRREEE